METKSVQSPGVITTMHLESERSWDTFLLQRVQHGTPWIKLGFQCYLTMHGETEFKCLYFVGIVSYRNEVFKVLATPVPTFNTTNTVKLI